jgi:S1-C subfamily serine protease
MSTLQDWSDHLANVVETAGQSIVRVEGRRRLPATGWVWSENLIVTAHHVVERNEDIGIGLPDGSTVKAQLVGRDPHSDLALLRADHGLNALPRPDSTLRVGHLVLAVGRPGSDVQTTLGVVSAIGMNLWTPEQDDSDEKAKRGRGRGRRARWAEAMAAANSRFKSLAEGIVQTDVVMYPGFSGGPLIDASGFVRGMNTSALGHGVSLALPLSVIESAVSMVSKHGRMRRGYLGVGAQAVHLPEAIAAQLGQDSGLMIVSVEAGSPAESGGLFIGDVIVAVDGEAVTYLEELLSALQGDRVGQPSTIKILRAGELRDVQVTIGERE